MVGRHMKFDRQAAVEIAMQAFWKQGYSNVSVNGLCAQIGITRSSFYNTFGSLDALFDEVVTLYLSQTPAEKAAERFGAMTTGSPTAQIRATFKLLCKSRARDPEAKGCLLFNTMGALSTLSGPARSTLLSALEGGRARFEALVNQAKDAGELPASADPEDISDSLQALIIGINTISKLIPSEDRLWRLASATLDGLGLRDQAELPDPSLAQKQLKN